MTFGLATGRLIPATKHLHFTGKDEENGHLCNEKTFCCVPISEKVWLH